MTVYMLQWTTAESAVLTTFNRRREETASRSSPGPRKSGPWALPRRSAARDLLWVITLEYGRVAQEQYQPYQVRLARQPQLLERAPAREAETPDLQAVDVNSLDLVRPRSVGVEALGLWAMEQLGLDGALERLGFSAKERALANDVRGAFRTVAAEALFYTPWNFLTSAPP